MKSVPYRRFFYIIEIYKKSSSLSPISVFYKPNRLKVAKIQPNKNLIKIGLKKEILAPKIFSYFIDQKLVSVFAYVPLTSRNSQIRTIGPVNGTADPLQLISKVLVVLNHSHTKMLKYKIKRTT